MWNENDERLVAVALNEAQSVLSYGGKYRPTGPNIVFETICLAADIERRERVYGGARPLRPEPLRAQQLLYLHTKNEREEAFKQRMIDLAAGDPVDVVFGIHAGATPREISTMESIVKIFRSCLVGKKQERDWTILYTLAKAKESIRELGRMFGISHVRVLDRKLVQCGAIWVRVKHLLSEAPLISPTLWKEADRSKIFLGPKFPSMALMDAELCRAQT